MLGILTTFAGYCFAVHVYIIAKTSPDVNRKVTFLGRFFDKKVLFFNNIYSLLSSFLNTGFGIFTTVSEAFALIRRVSITALT